MTNSASSTATKLMRIPVNQLDLLATRFWSVVPMELAEWLPTIHDVAFGHPMPNAQQLVGSDPTSWYRESHAQDLSHFLSLEPDLQTRAQISSSS